MALDGARCFAVPAHALAAAQRAVWRSAVQPAEGDAATPRPLAAVYEEDDHKEAETHFGLTVRCNRVDFSTPVAAVPPALIQALRASGALAADGGGDGSGAGASIDGDRWPAPNTCSVRALPHGAGAASEVVVEHEIFERPIFLLAMGECDLEVSILREAGVVAGGMRGGRGGGSCARGSGGGAGVDAVGAADLEGASSSSTTSSGRKEGLLLVVRVPRGHLCAFGGRLAAAPLQYRVRALAAASSSLSVAPPSPVAIVAAAGTNSAHNAADCGGESGSEAGGSSGCGGSGGGGASGGGGGGDRSNGHRGRQTFAVLRYCRVLDEIAALAAAVSAGTLSKTLMKRKIRVLTKATGSGGSGGSGGGGSGAGKRPFSRTVDGGGAATGGADASCGSGSGGGGGGTEAARKKAAACGEGGGEGGCAAKSMPLPAHLLPPNDDDDHHHHEAGDDHDGDDADDSRGDGLRTSSSSMSSVVRKLPEVETEHVQRV
jgi:hypothetical protein